MSVVTIYALYDPRNGKVCYVGKTQQKPMDRLYRHIAAARQGRTTFVAAWIRALLYRGRRPVLEVLEETDNECGPAREQFWIEAFIVQGHRLKNMTKGGYGSLGYKHNAKARAKIKAKRVQQTFSEETREKFRQNMAGNQRAVGSRGGCGFQKTGMPVSERLKRSEAMKRVRSERFWSTRP